MVKEFGKIAFTVPFTLGHDQNLEEGRPRAPSFVPVPAGYLFDATFDAHAARLFCRHFARKALGAYGHNIGIDGESGKETAPTPTRSIS